jgi:hypothetical protein
MRVSEWLHLGRSQPSLDFVDVDIATDISAFLDPRAIRMQKGPWIEHCQALLSSFFSALLDALSQNDESMAAELLVRLGERTKLI